MKDNKILIGTALVLLLLLTTGLSYAYFSTAVKGNDNAKDVVVNAGTLSLVYTDGPAINVQKIKPGWTTTKTVSVKNNGTLDTAYNIVWQELTNTILKNELVLSATCKRLNESGAVDGTCESITELPVRAKRIAKNISIESGFTHEYTFTFLFKETNSSQDYNQGKEFNGLLGIEEYKDTAVYCTYDGELTQGATFTKGDFTYKYKQSLAYSGGDYDWWNMTKDGWGVAITNRNSTNPIDASNVCTYINNKPIVSMETMFAGTAAKVINGLESLNTSNVTSMLYMFAYSQVTVLDVSNFDTSKVTTMSYMFSGSSVTSLDVSNFDTSNVTGMGYMLSGSKIVEIKGLENFNTSNVTFMNGMFSGIKVTTLNLNIFDTSKVTAMNNMFRNIQMVSIDLSTFDTRNVREMNDIFNGATSLKTIYVSNRFSIDKLGSYGNSNLFKNCTNLVGGAGTKYDSNHVDSDYAHIDGGTSNPGYFTDIADKK